MNKTTIEQHVEKYLNGDTTESLDKMDDGGSSLDTFLYNTAKRLIIAYQKYKFGEASADVYEIALRNYLLVFQTEIALVEDDILKENSYGIIRNADGRYYAVPDLPNYVDTDFVNQVFQRKDVLWEKPFQEGVFYGTNAFIYRLTKYKNFKSFEQKLAVYGALNTPKGYTTLVSLPTGGGKSLITLTLAYQQDGLTIVIVPTVSLAMDQVRKAINTVKHDTENEIFCYYSGIDNERKEAIWNAIDQEQARLLFISPEALIRNTAFAKIISEANSKRYLKNLIIDEAHIVIEWGDFFRVDYQVLEAWRNELLITNSQLRTILLSATYTRSAVGNLKQMFSSSGKWIEIRCDALRREPRFCVVKANSYSDKRRRFVELVKKLPHPMIVYVNSPQEAESIRSLLESAGINSLETFTGTTRASERERIISDWTADKADLIIATSAFGVGVDKSDVRTILHLYIPDTPNQYYQELGRGGRDGLASLSVMCINTVDDMDSAYKRMNKVLSADKIWGRWLSMYKSTTSSWYKGMVTLDTAVKPTYNMKADDEVASEIDIQWNVYVILLLRRYNHIKIQSMIYDVMKECYKIRVEIINDDLRNEASVPPKFIQDMRGKEARGFETEIRRIKRGIDNSDNFCWSEMFFDTYDMVSAYCGGCGKHRVPEMMEVGKFPLLLSVREPYKTITPELMKMCQSSREVLLIGEEDNYSIINRYLKAGVSIIVVDDVSIDHNFDLILNIESRSDIMIIGINEYRELNKLSAGFYVSGGILAIYNKGDDSACGFCNVLRKYRNVNMCLIHFVKDDCFNQKTQKPLSAMIDGPKMDSYILERM